MTTVVLAGKLGRAGTTITATGSPARIRGLRNRGRGMSRREQYMVKRIVMRHQHNAAEEVARETQQRVRDKTPKRSRKSAYSIQFVVRRTGDIVTAGVFSDYVNVKRLEEGTGVYGPRKRRITPRRGKVLRFPARGTGAFRLNDAIRQVGGINDPRARFIFTPSVAGQEPNWMFKRTAAEMRVRAPIIFRKHAHLAAMEIKARLR